MLSVFVFIQICCVCLASNVGKTIRLNSGYDCPVVGLGVGGHRTGGPPQDSLVKQMIRDAIDAGYRHIDTASAYKNEKAVGEVINELINSGKIRRNEIFITTKILSKSSRDTRDRKSAYDLIKYALEKLNTTYVDLLLIHHPSDDSINMNVWKGLEDAFDDGLVKSIGVSNFNVEQLTALLKTVNRIPAMNQIESNPNRNQRQLIDFCNEKSIRVTAFSPLGAGRLVFDPTIVAIGKRYNKTAAQVMLRWQIQREVIVIPKSTKKHRIQENIDVFDFNLNLSEMSQLEHFEHTVMSSSKSIFSLSVASIFIIIINLFNFR